jgi:ParB family chromosome partitioning protein
MVKKKGLGRGLSALIPDLKRDDSEELVAESSSGTSSNIPIKKIRINPWQPRREFDQVALEELAESIRTHGLIQPISVRRVDEHFELISGERRFRASKLIGLKEIPAYIKDNVGDEQMLQFAIIENLQREDLNPIEIAISYKRLIDEFNLTQEEVANKVGKNRTTVTNNLRLLNLPEVVQKSLSQNEISSGHARALLPLEDIASIVKAWKHIVENELSVRETENYVKNFSRFEQKTTTEKDELSQELKAIIEDTEDSLRNKFGTDVRIKFKKDEKGSIVINYYSKKDLNRILELLH